MHAVVRRASAKAGAHGENDRIGWYVLLNDALHRFEISNAKN